MRSFVVLALAALALARGGDARAWAGTWTARTGANQQSITIVRRGSLVRISGTDVWYDRAFAARGLIPVGTFTATIATPAGDRITIEPPDMPGCIVHLRRAGAYLVVRDNDRCGGINVTFTGNYRRVRKGAAI